MHGKSDTTTQVSQATFTSWKLDILEAANADERIAGDAFKVLFYILQSINQHTGITFPTIKTIAVKTRLNVRQVRRMIKLLKDAGWLIVKPRWDVRDRVTRNTYRVSARNVNRSLDQQVVEMEALKAKQAATKAERGAARKKLGPKPKCDPLCEPTGHQWPLATPTERPPVAASTRSKSQTPTKERLLVVERVPDPVPAEPERDDAGDDFESWRDRVQGDVSADDPPPFPPPSHGIVISAARLRTAA
jgi:hypothetical protein